MFCKRCGVELTDDNWRLCHRKKSYFICKKCEVEKNREWRQKNRDKLKAYYQRNRQRIRKRSTEWRERNREKFRECARRSYWKHRDKRLKKLKEWRQQSREEILDYNRSHVIRYHGYAIVGDKRSYPPNGQCELCGEKRRLVYHHWDNDNFKLGLWLCPHCHILAEKTEKGITSEKYLQLKAEVEAQEVRVSERIKV